MSDGAGAKLINGLVSPMTVPAHGKHLPTIARHGRNFTQATTCESALVTMSAFRGEQSRDAWIRHRISVLRR